MARVYTRWFEGKVEYMPGKHMTGLPPGQAVLKLVHCTELTACVYGAQAARFPKEDEMLTDAESIP